MTFSSRHENTYIYQKVKLGCVRFYVRIIRVTNRHERDKDFIAPIGQSNESPLVFTHASKNFT